MRFKEIFRKRQQVEQIRSIIGGRENRVVLTAPLNGQNESFVFGDPHRRPSRIEAFMDAYPRGSRFQLYVFDNNGQELDGMEFKR